MERVAIGSQCRLLQSGDPEDLLLGRLSLFRRSGYVQRCGWIISWTGSETPPKPRLYKVHNPFNLGYLPRPIPVLNVDATTPHQRYRADTADRLRAARPACIAHVALVGQ